MQLIFSRDTWELLSFVVTVIGLPLAIVVFAFEQRKERDNEEEEVYQLLSDNYQDFLKVALANPDLGLFSAVQTPALTEQQKQRRVVIFSMREWCERTDFHTLLPTLLRGEDPAFVKGHL